ncbi:MAG TPA: glycosyltransferase [Thermoanaerobaculia bacterium]|nr:glycosyltransferase [Thermoanaerobaculia bacterium]
MRILLASDHRYPARIFPLNGKARASARILDLTMQGLAELGHEVFYELEDGFEHDLPAGATGLRPGKRPAVDVVHDQLLGPYVHGDVIGLPWVRTCHSDLMARGWDTSRLQVNDNWIFVSRWLAARYGSTRAVHLGIDPNEYVYSETKEDYILFVASLDRAWEKGIDIALALCEKLGFELRIAGAAANPQRDQEVREACRGKNVKLLGEVFGREKAELWAGAKALLFPTQFNEAFGTSTAEALMCGTPVISSDRGAMPEVISPDVGFICSTLDDYEHALQRIDTIAPARCREKAMAEYHYLVMAERYVAEYEKAIAMWNRRVEASV